MKDFKVPVAQMACRSITNPVKVFACDMPTIGSIKKAYGDVFCQAYIETWIINFIDFVNLGKGMTAGQVMETALMILEEFYYMNLADINLVFKRAKSGYYGQLYDRIDGQIILGWFRAYAMERSQAAMELSIKESYSHKGRDTRQTKGVITPISDFKTI